MNKEHDDKPTVPALVIIFAFVVTLMACLSCALSVLPKGV